MFRSHAQSLTTAIYQCTERRNNIHNPQPEIYEVRAKKSRTVKGKTLERLFTAPMTGETKGKKKREH